jgi:hypothetical protein
MSRLLIHVEGQTEEAFVNDVLAPHLYGRGYEKVGGAAGGQCAAEVAKRAVLKAVDHP